MVLVLVLLIATVQATRGVVVVVPAAVAGTAVSWVARPSVWTVLYVPMVLLVLTLLRMLALVVLGLVELLLGNAAGMLLLEMVVIL